MSYTYEKVSGCKAKLNFVVAAADFEAAVQKTYLKQRGKIRVPGFRPGKAPRHVIQQMYGKAVFFEDAMDSIFGDMYEQALEAEKLEPVDRPSMTECNWDEVENGADLKFTVEVDVVPDVTLGDYKGLTVEVAKETVDEAAINQRIEQDRAKASRTEEVLDRPVEINDNVSLDYAGTVDGVAFEGGTAQGQSLTIGSHQFIPGFEEQMIGMCVGEERDLQVKFPEEYHAKELAGKDAVFHVKVNTISVTEMPELDDEFAADVSDFDTFADYKASIVKELEEKAEKNNRVAAENAVVAKATDNATIEIPKAMVDREIASQLRDMEMQMAQYGMRMEDYLKYTGQTIEQMGEQNRPACERRVKMQLVLEEIRKVENIEVTDEDFEKQLVRQAEAMGRDVEALKTTLNEQQMGYIRENAAVQKAVELMLDSATVTEKAPAADDAEDAE